MNMRIFRKLSGILFILFILGCTVKDDSLKKEENLYLLALSSAVSRDLDCKTETNFWVRNIETNTFYCMSTDKVAETSFIKLYVEKNLATGLDYTEVVKAFDEKIYPTSKDAFGTMSSIYAPDGKISVVILDIKDGATSDSGFVAGFVDPVNFYQDAPNSRSNEKAVLYMDGNELLTLRLKDLSKGYPDTFLSTLAHEYQHLLRYPYQIATGTLDDTWLDEGTSEVASDLTGYGPQTARIQCFRGDKTTSCTNGIAGQSLFTWSSSLKDYAFAYAFMSYLYNNSGTTDTEKNAFFKNTVTGLNSGIRAKDASTLMTAFKFSTGYKSSILGSDEKDMFKKLFASFMAQASGYTSMDTTYFGNSSAVNMESLRLAYPLPTVLKDIASPSPYSKVTKQTSYSLSPTQVYRVNGSINGISAGTDGVIIAKGIEEFVILNGSLNTSSTSQMVSLASEKELPELPVFQIQKEAGIHCPLQHLKSVHAIQKKLYNLKPLK